jgi:MFS family permease
MPTGPVAGGRRSDGGDGAVAWAEKESAWAPLRVKAFRALWLAQVGSAIGTWMQTVGAQWLLVEEPSAEALVAMVQVAAMLPVLVLALPSGALADILDRRRMLITVQLFQAGVAVALAALTVAGRMVPALLLTFTFLLGCGVALTLPAYQAFIQNLVPRTRPPTPTERGNTLPKISFKVLR